MSISGPDGKIFEIDGEEGGKMKYVRYTHHGRDVAVREDLRGKHRDY